MEADAVPAPAVQVDKLSFSLLPGGADLLADVSLELPRGSRCVMIGANGAGKSTLLELLAGKKMAPAGCVKVLGEDPFRGSSGNKVSLVQGVLRSTDDVVREAGGSFIRVWEMLGLEDPASSESAGRDPAAASDGRMRRLLEMLGLGRLLQRYVGSLSDGERRRVELGRKLRQPNPMVLLDEATTDLDLLVRQRLIDFLKADGATVVNVTHVFDGLEGWATHVVHLHEGRLLRFEAAAPEGTSPWVARGALFSTAVSWISEASPSSMPTAFPEPIRVGGGEGDLAAGIAAVEVKGLTFAYAPWAPVALRVEELALQRGCRCVVVGLNGCGKSTLLSILAGRRLVSEGEVRVLGHRAFHDHAKLEPRMAIMSTEWKRQIAEISAGRAMSFKDLANTAIQDLVAAGYDMAQLASRMVCLMQMLGIDPAKPLGSLSDGMMRRVQIGLKLLRPVQVLFVDEVTADLDVLGRRALLDFLRLESDAGCTVLYCTHILDGLEGWASSLLRVRPGGLSAELVSLDGSATLAQRVHAMLHEDEGVEPAPVPNVNRGAAGNEEALPSGWSERGATQAGAFGKYAWNAEKGPEDTWSYASVAPEPTNTLMQGAGAAGGFQGASAVGSFPGMGGGVAGPFAAGAGAAGGFPGMGGGAAGAFAGFAPGQQGTTAPGMPGRPASHDPWGLGERTNALPLEELMARGVIPRQ